MSNIDEVKLNGLKKYNFEGNLVESSYIQIEEITNYSVEIAYIIDRLMNYVKENNLKVFIFIVHNMKAFRTTVYNITANNYTVKYYNEYTSRGNNIIPEIEAELKKKILIEGFKSYLLKLSILKNNFKLTRKCKFFGLVLVFFTTYIH